MIGDGAVLAARRCRPRRAGTARRRRTSRGWRSSSLERLADALRGRRDRAGARAIAFPSSVRDARCDASAASASTRAAPAAADGLAGGGGAMRPPARARACARATPRPRDRALRSRALALGGHAIAHGGRVVARLAAAPTASSSPPARPRASRRLRARPPGRRPAPRGSPLRTRRLAAGVVERLARARARPRAAPRSPGAPGRAAPRDRAPRRRAPRPGGRDRRSAACRTGSAAGGGRSRARARAPASRASVAPDSASVSPSRTRLERGLELGDARGGRGFAGARLLEPRLGRFDLARERVVLARELHLLPAAQLLAQPLVAPRARRLALQRAALLLDFEDDVVDARQVLLRGLELELGRAAARLVLRDARRFFDQRAPLGRPRRQDLPDLALLDDRVGLDAQPRVHQQVVDVAQPADLAVDQVLALARSIQPPADLDVARDDAAARRAARPSASPSRSPPPSRPARPRSASAAPRRWPSACARRCR